MHKYHCYHHYSFLISWYQNRRSCSEGQLQPLPPGPRSLAPAFSRVSSILTLTDSLHPLGCEPCPSYQQADNMEKWSGEVNSKLSTKCFYLKSRGGSNSNEVCLATEKMDRKNNTVENISKNFSQTLDSVLTMANITNRQKDSWSLKKSFNDLFYWTYPHFLKLII